MSCRRKGTTIDSDSDKSETRDAGMRGQPGRPISHAEIKDGTGAQRDRVTRGAGKMDRDQCPETGIAT